MKKKKSGGQPGNKNALKHGFYSKQFSADESKRLNSEDEKELQSEINLLRVKIDRLSKLLFDKELFELTDNNGNIRTDDHYLNQLNTLSNMLTSLATLKRTQYMIQGRANHLNSAIEEALDELRLELGI